MESPPRLVSVKKKLSDLALASSTPAHESPVASPPLTRRRPCDDVSLAASPRKRGTLPSLDSARRRQQHRRGQHAERSHLPPRLQLQLRFGEASARFFP